MAFQTVFKRYELKYILTLEQKEKIQAEMLPYMQLDKYGRTTIRNVYFDTDNYRLIRRSIDKPAYKEKLRIRSYSQATADSTVFVELKKKYEKVVYKRRLPLCERDATAWVCRERPRPVDTQISREIDYFIDFYEKLKPTVFLSYEREAYYDKGGGDFRVTFDDDCLTKSDYLTPNSGSDTFALTQSYNGLSYQWTNYTTKVQESGWGGGPGGMGGFGDGNTDKGDHSTKGIKAANEIVINAGTINIKAYDDAIHANNDTTLQNGASPLGNVTVNGGNITAYSNDDGLHADGTLNIKAGTVSVTNAYEGLEGTQVNISGGYISVNSKDDGINATTQTGTAIAISGGTVYIYCTGDGIDSNSRTADVGIVFTGGKTVVISNSGMNSALDTENGYTYTAGSVIAIMPQGGMSSEATHCDNFSSVGAKKNVSLSVGDYLVVGIGSTTATVKMPVSLSAIVVVLGDNSPSISTGSSTSQTLDENGVAWQ